MDFLNNKLLDLNQTGTRRTGEMGRAKKLNGTDQAVRVSDNAAFDFTTALTVSVWAKNESASLSSGEWVIGKYDTGLNKREWLIGVRSNGQIRVNIGNADGSAESSEISIDSITPNVMNHLCFTFESGQVKIYLNGLLINSETTGTHLTSVNNYDADLTIGSFLNNDSASGKWNGQLFDARIYSSVLSASEIQSIYQDPANNIQFSGKTLVAHYKLDEQSGTTCFDSSGNSLHGTIENPTDNEATQDIVSFQNQVGYNKRMYFDGSNYVSLSSNPIPLGGMRMSANIIAYSTAGLSFICGSQLSGTNGNRYLIIVSGTVRFDAWGSDGVARSVSHAVSANTIYNVEGRINTIDNQIELWVDGILEDSLSVSEAFTTLHSNFVIGARSDNTAKNLFNGIISDVKVAQENGDNISVLNGYGNTDADWIDQIGSNNGTVNGSPSNIYLPRDEYYPTNDVLENPLTYTGQRPNDGALKQSNCLDLNGTNQAVRVADNTSLDITDNITVMVWAKNNSSNLVSSEIIISKFDYGNDMREWSLFVDTNEKVSIPFGNPSNGKLSGTWASDSSVAINEFNHYAFIFESGTVKFYLNGVNISGSFVNGLAPATLFNGTADLIIGAGLFSGSSVNYWGGQLYDCRIYSRVLSPAEIQSIYDDFRNLIDDPNLVGRWKCQEGAGIICHDSSGNENHGTIENASSNWGIKQDKVHSNLLEGHGKRMYFDGIDDFILLDSAIILSGDFTISLECFFSDLSSTRTLFANGNDNLLHFRSLNNYKARIIIDGVDNTFDFIPEINTYYYITISRFGTEVTLTVNGSSQTKDFGTSGNLSVRNIGSRLSSASSTLAGGIWNVNFDSQHLYQGYGNTDSEWVDQIGSNNGTVQGSPENIYLPSKSSTLDVFDQNLTDPAGKWINRAETVIDFNPDSTPEMINFGDYTVPSSYKFGDTIDSGNTQAFKRSEDNKEDRFVFYKNPVNSKDLEVIQTYMSSSRI